MNRLDSPVNFPSIYDIYNKLIPILEDSDKTEVRFGSSWIITQPLNEKQQFSVQAVGFACGRFITRDLHIRTTKEFLAQTILYFIPIAEFEVWWANY